MQCAHPIWNSVNVDERERTLIWGNVSMIRSSQMDENIVDWETNQLGSWLGITQGEWCILNLSLPMRIKATEGFQCASIRAMKLQYIRLDRQD
ncbi:hypothetical protein OPQ81_000368 [Rhizoctonia solani]|nr:hypothetical protein OPQ81_000368 [Rhizoctonia solani]